MCGATMQMDSIVSSTEDFVVLMKALTDIPKPKQQRKRVRFSAEFSCSAPSDLTRKELKSLWYDTQTILNFRTEARNIVFFTNVEKKNENTRGLQSCTLFERQLQRHKTIQCILSSCKKGYTWEQTAAMAQKCSTWNRDIALLQACRDFFEVYQPSMPLPDISQTPPAFPFELKRASCSSSTSTSCCQPPRRVRRRRTV
jgi:hypothetical protein